MRIMLRRLSTWARGALRGFRASLTSISDPNLARIFGWGRGSYAGVDVSESSTVGLSAVYRALDLISGTLGQLPLRTLKDAGRGRYVQVKSIFDDPGGKIGINPVVWKRLVFVHLSLYNETFLRHVYGGGGQLLALQPVHPLVVSVTWALPSDRVQPAGGKWFDLTLVDGTRERHDAGTLTHAMAFTLDGLRGLWITSIGRDSLGTAIANERSAAKMMSDGMTVAGIFSPDDDEGWGDSAAIREELNAGMGGWENAGGIAVTNRKGRFQQISLSAVDAQFLESRMFSIEEVARWFGVPPFELMQTDKQTSWGTGIESQQRGLGRQLLAPKASCLEAALMSLAAVLLLVRFDFSELERPSPDRIEEQTLAKWNAGLITQNEARIACGLDPLPGGDVFKGAAAPALPAADVVPDTVPEDLVNA